MGAKAGLLLGVFLVPIGCLPAGGNSGSETTSITIELRNSGTFTFEGDGTQTESLIVNVEEDLPDTTPTNGSVLLSTARISLTATGDESEPEVEITIRIADLQADDPCTSAERAGPFLLTLDTADRELLEMTSDSLSATALELIMQGEFQLCIDVDTDAPIDLDIDSIDLVLTSFTGTGCSALATGTPTCDLILANDEVARVIGLLPDENLPISTHSGTTPPSLIGTWEYTRTVEYDPSGETTGRVTTGTLEFSEQSGGTVLQTIGSASLGQSLTGTSDELTLCGFARSGGDCDTSVAGVTNYFSRASGDAFAGQFFSVVACVDAGRGASCDDPGGFLYGTISLVSSDHPPDEPAVNFVGKVELPDDMTPVHMALFPDGLGGIITGTEGEVLRFDTTSSFTTTEIMLPLEYGFGFSGLGISLDGSRYAVIADAASTVVVFDAETDAVIGQATAPVFNLSGGELQFSIDAEQLFVLSPDSGDGDAVVIVPAVTEGTVELTDADRIATPSAQSPNSARLGRTGDQLAVVFTGSGTDGRSSLLSFLDLSDDPPTFGPLISTLFEGGGLVRNGQLIYSADGGTLFLAGENGVVAVETAAPFDVTVVDVARRSGDPVQSVSLGAVAHSIVAGVAADGGDVDLALVDGDSIVGVHSQNIVALAGPLSQIVHFENAAAALVIPTAGASLEAVGTVPPYSAIASLSVSELDTDDSLGPAVAASSVVAVLNVDEPAIYVFEAVP